MQREKSAVVVEEDDDEEEEEGAFPACFGTSAWTTSSRLERRLGVGSESNTG